MTVTQIRPALPDLKDIVARLGGDLSHGGRMASVPSPGHHKKDRGLSLRVSDDGERILFHSFNGASPRDVFAYLGIEGASEYKPSRQEYAVTMRRREAEARKLEAEKLAFCAEVWNGTLDLAGSLAARYLRNRGLVLDGCPDIRFHPSAPRRAPWSAGTDAEPPLPIAAMVCLARNGRGEPRGIHATYISPEGMKAFGGRSRLMFGPMSGAALRTAPIATDGTLAVAEGVETAGGYSVLRSVPTWATFSTSGLTGFEVPAEVRRLLIAADHDENGAGFKAAEQLAHRVRGRCEVEIEVPRSPGDWSTVMMEGADG